MIYGGAGLGKTITANRYREEHSNVWIATMMPSINTVAACLERVASAVGISTLFSSAVRAENAIINRVIGTGGLIIVDEAQHSGCLQDRYGLSWQRKRVHATYRWQPQRPILHNFTAA